MIVGNSAGSILLLSFPLAQCNMVFRLPVCRRGKQLLELESQLLSKGVECEITAEAREWLAQKGYDRQMGARPMARVIQDQLKKPLSEEVLFGKLENGGSVRV
ncbi:MAG: hypothetical protein KGL74_00485, partial [Elusimicrobia bacterium]|nr:hypothetical protein [Elusimicrobiota bacterium]